MEHFYDGQVKRYLTQFMRLMSGFCYKDASGKLIQVPVRYGDMTRQVGSIINKNSENILQSAPFIACYISDLKFDRGRMQDPTYVSKLKIRERAFDDQNNEYLNYQGANYTVERLMPTPYVANFTAEIWTTNLDQKLQLWEQITVLFNPSLELQTTDNYIDWTSLSVLELMENSKFETKTIPQGLDNNLSITNLQFTAPIWISPPAKVKKLGIITQIITNVFCDTGVDVGAEAARISTSLDDYGVLVLNNTAVLVPNNATNACEGWVEISIVTGKPSWLSILDKYPGKFTPGLSQLRLMKPDGNEIVATISLNPTDETLMALSFDQDTIPANTILSDLTSTFSRGTIDAIINPQTFNPHSVAGQNIDRRYLILEDINVNPLVDEPGYDGPDAWKNINGDDFRANANDIIQWDGVQWNVILDSTTTTEVTYITNAYTGIQYKWEDSQWVKSFEGVYTEGKWRMVL